MAPSIVSHRVRRIVSSKRNTTAKSPPMERLLSIERAVHNVLAQSLALRAEQNLLMFADQEALPVADAMTSGARMMGVQATTIYVPRSTQSSFSVHEALPFPVEAAVREADAIVSCLSDRPEHFAYRTRILRHSWRRRMKIAHLPGMTLDILTMADTDYDHIAERCSLLALALVLGREIELQTRRVDGTLCVLCAELRGWEFPPGISDGVIPEGSWANLPPGEAFAIPFQARGEVAINGSLPGRVLDVGEELVLAFENGRLRSIAPENSDAARHLQTSQIERAEKQNDRNWTNLAEIGIGLNPTIDCLRGIPIHDEKKAGTAHIALGNNTLLGGAVDSTIHCDLVIEAPTVTIDGKPILVQGRWALIPEDWLLDHRQVEVPYGWWEGIQSVRRSGSRGDKENGRLQRRWTSRSGQRAPFPVGRDQTARMAQRLYGLLQAVEGNLLREVLIAQAGQESIDAWEIPGLLWVLLQYDLIRVQNGGG